ncbi:PTS fructose transporter subunit IID [Tetragenococcus halophilus subsp. flandriensis]|uniref:PTS system mannose/fructose/sorbose family transporter subunit IID n=1 Tax=Tetragenococcus halophilus TaxID=51669 RepID=UPI0023E9C129|nr:PTS system mannose/fructose/sorbose family transporter subunit IID [Tetragenococcus halophilus]GMA08815.1 PTS fructose transporter subunit IID [Tetragenococcus halophilus subsp. flandriensis]
MEDSTKLVSEKEVRNTWLRFYLTAEMAISFERLQALGFCSSLVPILTKFYPKEEDLKKALKRHLVFYNSEAVFGGAPIIGIIIALEEQKASDEPIGDDVITGLKTGLMGPLAGIGDSINWATLKPIIFSLGASLSAGGNPIGAFVLLLLPVIQLLTGARLSVEGYKLGRASIRDILNSGRINKLLNGASTLGLLMMGALSSTYVDLSTPLEFSFGEVNEAFILQDILDGIVPGLLPLLAVLGIYWWLNKKNQNMIIIVLLILAISLLGAITGIL